MEEKKEPRKVITGRSCLLKGGILMAFVLYIWFVQNAILEKTGENLGGLLLIAPFTILLLVGIWYWWEKML